MAVCRVHKNDNFTVMSNAHLRDKTLSLKAIGLLSKVFSLPEDWDYSIAGLVAICKESETAIKGALGELKQAGYLKISKTKGTGGKFCYVYDFYETPKPADTLKNDAEPESSQFAPEVGFPPLEHPPLEVPPLENPPLEVPAVENHGQLNKEEPRTDLSNTDNQGEGSTRAIAKPPSMEDVLTYARGCGYNSVDCQAFHEHYTRTGWTHEGKPVRSWRGLLRCWDEQAKRARAVEPASCASGTSALDVGPYKAIAQQIKAMGGDADAA